MPTHVNHERTLADKKLPQTALPKKGDPKKPVCMRCKTACVGTMSTQARNNCPRPDDISMHSSSAEHHHQSGGHLKGPPARQCHRPIIPPASPMTLSQQQTAMFSTALRVATAPTSPQFYAAKNGFRAWFQIVMTGRCPRKERRSYSSSFLLDFYLFLKKRKKEEE
jgi:hypothetical protein